MLHALLLSLSLPLAAAVVPTPEDRGPRNVAIVVFPGVELLDFAGPGEVFASTHFESGHAFHVYTVAVTNEPVVSQGFVRITPGHALDDCPRPDIVVVPGGNVPAGDPKLRAWLIERSKDAEVVMSVCNGALVLGSAGLLQGLEVTTHRSALEALALTEPSARVFTNRRFVDNGRIVTAAGVSAGIDGALQVVSRLCGEEVAWQTARYMEYDWRPDELAKLHAQPGRPIEAAAGIGWVASVRKLGLERALAEYRAHQSPPNESTMNRWGYGMANAGRLDDAIALFELVNAAFPSSANAADSLSEALERKGDRERAAKIAQDSLARLAGDSSLDPARRKILHNAAASRVARMTGRPDSEFGWVCPPCDGECDAVAYLEPGRCPGCPMELVRKESSN